MSARFADWDDRTLELAADHVTEGLDPADSAELRASVSAVDLEEFERVTAAVNIAGLGRFEAPSAELLRALEADALRVLEHGTTTSPAPSAGRSASAAPRARGVAPWFAAAGWLAAAALALAFLLRGETGRQPGLAWRRESLLAVARDLARADWQHTDDPLGAQASGDVVWSSARQEGYMRFHRLTPNDPGRNQYQLWIFDPTRDDWEARPVDGGVFDVGPDGEVLVAIDPKLEVRKVAMFAVTLEPPGGVVVSKREHLVLTARL